MFIQPKFKSILNNIFPFIRNNGVNVIDTTNKNSTKSENAVIIAKILPNSFLGKYGDIQFQQMVCMSDSLVNGYNPKHMFVDASLLTEPVKYLTTLNTTTIYKEGHSYLVKSLLNFCVKNKIKAIFTYKVNYLAYDQELYEKTVKPFLVKHQIMLKCIAEVETSQFIQDIQGGELCIAC